DAIYWIAQILLKDGSLGDRTAAYNGNGRGSIFRIKRRAATPERVLMVPNQDRATGLGVDGGFLYWTLTSAGAGTQVMRVPRDCTACRPEQIGSGMTSPGTAFLRMKPGLVAIQGQDGAVYFLEGTQVREVTRTGLNGAL